MKQIIWYKSIALVFAMLLLFGAQSQMNKFAFSINSLATNFHYGKLNSVLQPFKKDFKGWQIGASYQVGINRRFSVVPEVYFSTKGGILKHENPLTMNKSTVRLNSLEAPVLGRLHFKKLYLNTGPYVSYTLGGRIKVDGSEFRPGKSTTLAFGRSNEKFKRWDVGIQAGAGYNFNMKGSVLTLDVRYGYGLISASRDPQRFNRLLNISLLSSNVHKKRTSLNRLNK